jgi:alpha-L-arabinofuranosidase
MASYAPLFGHIDGWQWKPNLIWVDNLQVMPTPNYQVQKLYATNKGNLIIPMLYKDKMPATGQDSLYASATLDKASNELIIKIVNASAKAQTAEVNIEGVKKLDGKAKLITLQHDNLEAENTMEAPAVIAPIETMIEPKGKGVTLDVKGHSFSVIRIKL